MINGTASTCGDELIKGDIKALVEVIHLIFLPNDNTRRIETQQANVSCQNKEPLDLCLTIQLLNIFARGDIGW